MSLEPADVGNDEGEKGQVIHVKKSPTLLIAIMQSSTLKCNL